MPRESYRGGKTRHIGGQRRSPNSGTNATRRDAATKEVATEKTTYRSKNSRVSKW